MRSFAGQLTVVAGAQFLYCLAMGIEDTNDISYRQSVALTASRDAWTPRSAPSIASSSSPARC